MVTVTACRLQPAICAVASPLERGLLASEHEQSHDDCLLLRPKCLRLRARDPFPPLTTILWRTLPTRSRDAAVARSACGSWAPHNTIARGRAIQQRHPSVVSSQPFLLLFFFWRVRSVFRSALRAVPHH